MHLFRVQTEMSQGDHGSLISMELFLCFSLMNSAAELALSLLWYDGATVGPSGTKEFDAENAQDT